MKKFLLLFLVITLIFIMSCESNENKTSDTSSTDSSDCSVSVNASKNLEEYIEKSNRLIQTGLCPNFFLSVDIIEKIGNFYFFAVTPDPERESAESLSAHYSFLDRESYIVTELYIRENEATGQTEWWESLKNKPESESHKIISDSTAYENIFFLEEMLSSKLEGKQSYWLSDCNAYVQCHISAALEQLHGYMTNIYFVCWTDGELSFELQLHFKSTNTIEEFSNWQKEITQLNNVKAMIEEINQSLSPATE